MKKYIEFDDFKRILNDLKLNEEITFYVEFEEGRADEYDFKNMEFYNKEVILYNVPQLDEAGVIQDSMLKTKEDEIEEVWEIMSWHEEFNIYIEE